MPACPPLVPRSLPRPPASSLGFRENFSPEGLHRVHCNGKPHSAGPSRTQTIARVMAIAMHHTTKGAIHSPTTSASSEPATLQWQATASLLHSRATRRFSFAKRAHRWIRPALVTGPDNVIRVRRNGEQRRGHGRADVFISPVRNRRPLSVRGILPAQPPPILCRCPTV